MQASLLAPMYLVSSNSGIPAELTDMEGSPQVAGGIQVGVAGSAPKEDLSQVARGVQEHTSPTCVSLHS